MPKKISKYEPVKSPRMRKKKTPSPAKKTEPPVKKTSPLAADAEKLLTPSKIGKLDKYGKLKTDKEIGDAYAREADYQNSYRARRSSAGRDISPIPYEGIDWDRRLACKNDFKLFCETYGSDLFYLGWSDPQLECIDRMEKVIHNAGVKFAMAMPRGGGKTTLCRMGIICATAYGFKRYPLFIGSSSQSAEQTLHSVKQNWYRNEILFQDFPELAYPIVRLENRWHLASGQTYNGDNTSIQWGTEEIRYPIIQLEDEIAEFYLKHDPDSLVWIERIQRHLPISAGCKIEIAGMDSSIRGKAETNPITLESVRPDLVLLDDVQKDQKAESPTSCEKMIIIIDGAIDGLSGPESALSALMPCTVIREGDVSDTYLTPEIKPEWQGHRTKMVQSWPAGITDFDITMETRASQLWNQYDELRKKSISLYGDMREATSFYSRNRKEMDEGFVVTWTDRYVKSGVNKEISPQQHAMNKRLQSPRTFPSEYQNIGRRLIMGDDTNITSLQLRRKVIPGNPRGTIPMDSTIVTTFVDVQDELLFWLTISSAPDFTSVVVDYGTFPEVPHYSFTKEQTRSWSLLSKSFFETYPNLQHLAKIGSKNSLKAPFDEKIYHALQRYVPILLARKYPRSDGIGNPLECGRLAIDARWGIASDSILRYISDIDNPNVLAYYGASISPVNKQLEEYTRTGEYRSWLFEDQVNPIAEHCHWVIRPGKDGRGHFFVDVDRAKDFAFARLNAPAGGSGSLCLFDADSEDHALFSRHICESEYAEPIEGRGVKKNKWLLRDGKPDNDWLDCLVGALMLASLQGAHLKYSKGPVDDVRAKRSLRSLYDRKRGRRSR